MLLLKCLPLSETNFSVEGEEFIFLACEKLLALRRKECPY